MDRAAGPERVLTRPAQRLIATAAVLVVAVAGCSSHGGAPASSAPPASSSGSASVSASGKVTIAAADRGACAQLFARLQQVSGVLTASSELLANALDKQQLSQRIADEQAQLQRSADLMAQGPIPAPLVDADHQIVEALRAFTDDFARAKEPAARGDFQAAADEMTDQAVVQRIVDASKTIEDACS